MSKAYETLLRLQRWQLDEERRRLGTLFRAQERLARASQALERERQQEARLADSRAGDGVDRAYPAYAGRVRGEQEQLADGLAELDHKITGKRDDVAQAYLALKQVEIVRDKQAAARRLAADRREQVRLDEIGLDMHRRQAVGTTRA